jgi:hypothetical protein
MANKSPGTWYVAFEVRRRDKRKHATATETFRSEVEAKKFATAKLAETPTCHCGHAQSSSTETDHRRSADT